MNEDKAARYQRLARRGRALAVVSRGGVLIGSIAVGFPPDVVAPALARVLPASVAVESLVAAVSATLGAVALGVAAELAALPFIWHVEFALERRYRLSREPFRAWLRDHVVHVSARRIGWWASAAGMLFLVMAYRPDDWWWLAGGGFLAATVVRATLAPRLLARWRFESQPLGRPVLRERLEALARRSGAAGIGIHEWCIGGRSDTANAMVVGIGPSRRILVSDTLLDDYSEAEIEVVVAHELAHHAHRDLWQALAVDAGVVTTACGLAHWILTGPAVRAGLPGLGEVAGLPLLALIVSGLVVAGTPLTRGLSRWHERRADRYAIRITGNRDAFVSGLRRLGAQHLAEERPSRLVEWLFYSHPPLGARMAAVRAPDGHLARH